MEGWHPSLGVSEGITTRMATPPEAWPHLVHEGQGLAGPAADLGCWCQGLRVGRLCPALWPRGFGVQPPPLSPPEACGGGRDHSGHEAVCPQKGLPEQQVWVCGLVSLHISVSHS